MGTNTRQAVFFGPVRKRKTTAKQRRWLAGMVGKYLLVIAVFVAYSAMMWLLGARTAREKAEYAFAVSFKQYQDQQEEIRRAEEEAAAEAARPTYASVINDEAEALSRVLYGVKGNSTDDLRTYAWCVLNRVDNSAYPDTVQAVIDQPSQWMAYDPEAPVLDSLYDIAYEVLEVWHSGAHRPVSNEFVYMNWSPREIVLRDNWTDGSGTHYWRWK